MIFRYQLVVRKRIIIFNCRNYQKKNLLPGGSGGEGRPIIFSPIIFINFHDTAYNFHEDDDIQ